MLSILGGVGTAVTSCMSTCDLSDSSVSGAFTDMTASATGFAVLGLEEDTGFP